MILRTIAILILLHFTWEMNFDRTIIAVHFPMYKILLSLGDCKNRTLYFEQQLWASIKMNRMMDIFYASNDSYSKVSRVEIRLIVNTTEFSARAFTDLGSSQFRAHIIFPIHCGATFYSLNIYTCNPAKKIKLFDYDADYEMSVPEGILSQIPFYIKRPADIVYT